MPLGTIHSASPKLLLHCQICRRHQTGTAAGGIIRRAALIPILQTIKCYHPDIIVLVHYMYCGCNFNSYCRQASRLLHLERIFDVPVLYSILPPNQSQFLAKHMSLLNYSAHASYNDSKNMFSCSRCRFQFVLWPLRSVNQYSRSTFHWHNCYTCSKNWSETTWELKKVPSICFVNVIVTYIQGFLVNDIDIHLHVQVYGIHDRPLICIVHT